MRAECRPRRWAETAALGLLPTEEISFTKSYSILSPKLKVIFIFFPSGVVVTVASSPERRINSSVVMSPIPIKSNCLDIGIIISREIGMISPLCEFWSWCYNEIMVTLKEAIAEAEKKGIAIGHFNISTTDALWGIFDAARELNVPIIIGVSEGERSFIGVRQAKALVQSIQDEYHYPIFLNADHSYSFDSAKEAIDAGYDAVIFDGAKLPLEENIAITKQVVEYARKTAGEVLVEGELGYIGESSSILSEIPEAVKKSGMTTSEEATRFVAETGVDLFAPAVGNIHGMLRDLKEPPLDIPRIKAIRSAAGVPLVLHGGSGTSDDDFMEAIKAGISIVHINTEIRKAWRDALGVSIQEDPDTVAPYKILKNSREAVRKVVFERLKLFSGMA